MLSIFILWFFSHFFLCFSFSLFTFAFPLMLCLENKILRHMPLFVHIFFFALFFFFCPSYLVILSLEKSPFWKWGRRILYLTFGTIDAFVLFFLVFCFICFSVFFFVTFFFNSFDSYYSSICLFLFIIFSILCFLLSFWTLMICIFLFSFISILGY